MFTFRDFYSGNTVLNEGAENIDPQFLGLLSPDQVKNVKAIYKKLNSAAKFGLIPTIDEFGVLSFSTTKYVRIFCKVRGLNFVKGKVDITIDTVGTTISSDISSGVNDFNDYANHVAAVKKVIPVIAEYLDYITSLGIDASVNA